MICQKCKVEIPGGALGCAPCCLKASEAEVLARFHRGEVRLWTARVGGITHIACERHAHPYCRDEWKSDPSWKRASRAEIETDNVKRSYCAPCLESIGMIPARVSQ